MLLLPRTVGLFVLALLERGGGGEEERREGESGAAYRLVEEYEKEE
jgi:hypothetical protein